MRLGGFFDEKFNTPEEWVKILQSKGYRAAYSPYRIPPGGQFPGDSNLQAYREAAEAADIVIAEVGAWDRNYVSENPAERELAVTESIRLLEMAEKLGARCLVNSAGWRSDPHQNFSEETFRLIVDTVQAILDAARPSKTTFTLELVPDIYPYAIDSYLDLLEAVDRDAFGVHFDLANITVTPYRCYHNAELIQECLEKLGPRIKSCHAKDVTVRKGMIVHIDEVRPGLGCLDYVTLIRGLDLLDPDIPLMMEHLPNNQEYALAAGYILKCAAESRP